MKNFFQISRALKVSLAVIGCGLASISAATPAAAVSFNTSSWADRFSTVGTTTTTLTSSASTHCFMTGMRVAETDIPEETVRCLLVRGPTSWTINATLGATGDANVMCDVTCYNN